MNNPLKILEGKLLNVSMDDGVLHLSSEDDWHLVVYNSRELLSSQGDKVLLVNGERKFVTKTKCPEWCAIMEFRDGSSLHINLSPDAYVGPEAMQLTGPNGLIVVWN